MPKIDHQKIQDLMGQMDCPKHFICADQGFEQVCKAKLLGDSSRLLCLEEDELPCLFARVWFVGKEQRFCVCPLRVYLARECGK